MQFVVELNLNWNKLLLNQKDFIALSEILDRATVVENNGIDWGDKYKQYLVLKDHRGVEARSLTRDDTVVTWAEYSALSAEASEARKSPEPAVAEVA